MNHNDLVFIGRLVVAIFFIPFGLYQMAKIAGDYEHPMLEWTLGFVCFMTGGLALLAQ